MTWEQLYQLLDAMSEDELKHPVILLSSEGGYLAPTTMVKTIVEDTAAECAWPLGQHVLVA